VFISTLVGWAVKQITNVIQVFTLEFSWSLLLSTHFHVLARIRHYKSISRYFKKKGSTFHDYVICHSIQVLGLTMVLQQLHACTWFIKCNSLRSSKFWHQCTLLNTDENSCRCMCCVWSEAKQVKASTLFRFLLTSKEHCVRLETIIHTIQRLHLVCHDIFLTMLVLHLTYCGKNIKKTEGDKMFWETTMAIRWLSCCVPLYNADAIRIELAWTKFTFYKPHVYNTAQEFLEFFCIFL
jgi:hypothetical protein